MVAKRIREHDVRSMLIDRMAEQKMQFSRGEREIVAGRLVCSLRLQFLDPRGQVLEFSAFADPRAYARLGRNIPCDLEVLGGKRQFALTCKDFEIGTLDARR